MQFLRIRRRLISQGVVKLYLDAPFAFAIVDSTARDMGMSHFLQANSLGAQLHPVAIIMAVLFFGGIWGLWGVFFAIPLATLIKAIISAWPSSELMELPGPAS